MRIHIDHDTDYAFDRPAPYGLQEVRLSPRDDPGQKIVSWSLSLEGAKAETSFDDQHGNRVLLISIEPGARRVAVRCDGVVETADRAGVVGPHRGCAPLWYFLRETPLTTSGPNLRRLADGLGGGDDAIARMHALTQRLADQLAYVSGSTAADTTAEDALTNGRGVCQDHAHAFVAAARLMGFPARYVSGYLLVREGTPLRATHAWAEAHISGLGWVGFDPSNQQSPDERYVRVATGLDYREAAPISGLRFGDGQELLTVSVQVQQQ
ncbi:MAG: transglutaminase family protein [Parvularculaceae bacterium]|nr:transglutaminase family protein [Parvularculaceae bacterium]